MSRKDKKYELKRTCKRCSTDWFVSLSAAKEKMPSRAEKAGATSRAWGDRLAPGGKRGAGELQLLNLEQRKQRIANINSCPACGSGSFKEKQVKK